MASIVQNCAKIDQSWSKLAKCFTNVGRIRPSVGQLRPTSANNWLTRATLACEWAETARRPVRQPLETCWPPFGQLRSSQRSLGELFGAFWLTLHSVVIGLCRPGAITIVCIQGVRGGMGNRQLRRCTLVITSGRQERQKRLELPFRRSRAPHARALGHEMWREYGAPRC